MLRDYAINVKRMLEVLAKVDIEVEEDFQLEVIPIKYGKVDEIYATLTSVIGGGGVSGTPGGGVGGAGGVGGMGGGMGGRRGGMGGVGGMGSGMNQFGGGGQFGGMNQLGALVAWVILDAWVASSWAEASINRDRPSIQVVSKTDSMPWAEVAPVLVRVMVGFPSCCKRSASRPISDPIRSSFTATRKTSPSCVRCW